MGTIRRPLLLAVAIVAIHCGDDEGVSTDLGPRVEQGTTADGAGGVSVEVLYDGKTNPVALGKLTPVDVAGTSYVKLSDVVSSALPGTALDSLLADFEAGDGFRPARSPNCTSLIPLDGAKLSQGYVQPQSRNMRWDDVLAYPGCMSTKNLAKIILTKKGG